MTGALLHRNSCGWYDYWLYFYENIAYTEKKGYKNWGENISNLLIPTVVWYRLIAIRICKHYLNWSCSS